MGRNQPWIIHVFLIVLIEEEEAEGKKGKKEKETAILDVSCTIRASLLLVRLLPFVELYDRRVLFSISFLSLIKDEDRHRYRYRYR